MTHLPTIHLNGTSAESLYEEYHALRLAVRVAIKALENATCNARDFYPQEDRDAYQKARKERTEMFEHLCAVSVYAEAWEFHAFERRRK